MTSRIRVRLGAAAVAAAAIGGMLALSQPAAQAAPAYQNSFIAFGGSGPGWTVVNTDGTNQHTITPSGGDYDPTTMAVSGLKYSPDGSHAAFAAGGTGNAVALWVAAADGTGAHKLAALDANVYQPKVAWSPDGKVVYYSANGQIFQVNADGTGTPTVAFADSGNCKDTSPQTTHNGYIYFARACSGKSPAQYAGYAIHRPGDLLPVPTGGQSIEPSAISPDGTRYVMDYPLSKPGSNQSLETLIVNPMNSDDIMHHTVQLAPDHSLGALGFGPSGDLVYADTSYAETGAGQDTYTSTIQTAPDAVNQTPHTVVTIVGAKPGVIPVQFVDWVDGPANFGTRPVADRVGGGDRIATSIAASKWTYDAKNGSGRKASAAVLARSDTFADALGGTALAIQSNGPLLLTPTAALDKGVAAELTRILQPHATVYVLGGTSALSPAVANQLTALGFSVNRVSGDNRYATAVAIATEIGGTPHQTDSVLIATGVDYPDALTAGVAAGQDRYTGMGESNGDNGGVVVLTDGTSMPPETAAYLKQIDPHVQHVYAVGGQAVKAVSAAFPSWTGVTPLAGANRYETAAAVAKSSLFGSGAAGRYPMVGVATAGTWPDALAGGALIGNQGGPLLLADASGTPGSQSAIVSAAHLKGLVVFGGTAAVPDKALAAIANNAFGLGAWNAAFDRDAPALP
ncbi:cell wall-binding repeat-containing protein [Catenulispora sp. NL8]|uniref:Cell wall-binding repeat-containing protein n=1 Tax=Catenulispora pinistramenti TaxID=2705254 RepID=A0ABS5KLX3_9ACTN|nr:cell wall-binding repeat-containing protein [Catenulispora pinistramenti]MBS2547051.1 cell wall-binding repeat-containing protein [Catenulispora pinistramenti]